MRKLLVVPAFIMVVFASCTVVRPGEVGMMQTLGVIKPTPILKGSKGYNPFVTTVVKISTRITEVYSELIVPTREGLSINTEISLLYHIKADSVRNIYTLFGKDFQEVVVMSNFRACTREVTARYYATELYSTEREKIERAIKYQLSEAISKYGFEVDAVLLKDIVLPDQITRAIQNKVQSEQEALQMDFIIQKQKKEAERMLIEAEAIRQSQDIINKAMTKEALQYKYLEMLKSLSNSGNSKIILTNGDVPVMMNTDTNTK